MLTRTYSRKGSKRASRSATAATTSHTTSPGRSPSPTSRRYRKRQKIQVEVVKPSTSPTCNGDSDDDEDDQKLAWLQETQTAGTSNSHASAKPLSATGRYNEPLSLSRSRTYLVQEDDMPSSRKSLRKAASQQSLHESSTSPIKDLTDLFSSFPPAPSSKRPPLSPKPSGVAKRMHPLRRTQTSPAAASSASNSLSHASSLSFLPSSSSSSPRKLALSHTEPMIDHTGSVSFKSPGPDANSPRKSRSHPTTGSIDVDDAGLSSAVRPPLNATANSVRTYTGKSRSFLLAMPVSQADELSPEMDDASLQELGIGTDIPRLRKPESLEEERESYTSLRLRYGIDASEDDPILPFPRPPTPPTPGDPSKRKGKGRAHHVLQPQLQPAEKLPEGMMNDLRSITELRSKGEARRFLDEVGYLFEGLDRECVLGVRRGSAIEIVSKLCNTGFARRAQAADFLGRAWDMLRAAGSGDTNGDKVLNTVLVLYVALVAKDPLDLADLARRQTGSVGFVEILFTLLEQESDPLWLLSAGLSDTELKQTGIAKGDKASLSSLWKIVKNDSGLFEADEMISNRLLISYTLARLVPSLISCVHLPQLLVCLRRELSPLASRLAAYASGLPLSQCLTASSYKEIPSLSHIDHCLRLLDAYLLGQWVQSGSQEAEFEAVGRNGLETEGILSKACGDGLGEQLIALCVTLDILGREEQNNLQRDIAKRCMESVLRVLVNLTHNNGLWCEAIMKDPNALSTVLRLVVASQTQRQTLLKTDSLDRSETTFAEDDTSAQLLDRLCLALGLLTNLVQCMSEAKRLVHNSFMNIHCPGKRSCIPTCVCTPRISSLQCLAHVYIQLCRSSNDLDTVVRGHVAILFGLLMQDDWDNQRMLLNVLPGGTQRRKLDSLLENAKEFTAFYVRFATKAAQVVHGKETGNDELDEEDGETVRNGDAFGMQRVLQDEKGEDVAKSVITFLEQLRKHLPDAS